MRSLGIAPDRMRPAAFLSKFCRLRRGSAANASRGYNTGTMATLSHRSREKIALAVFAGLIVLSLCGFGWYLLAGHSWNVAASNIDDTFGSMEGYTAIVYDGVEHPVDPEDLEGAGTAEDDEPVAPGLLSATGSGTGSGSAARGAAAGGLSSAKKGATAAEAKMSYEEKGATVFSLDTADPRRYEEGTILKKGAHRFGVFSVLDPRPVRSIERQVAYFTEHEVDFIVVLTSDSELLEDVEGVDIVLSVGDEELFVMGETVDGTFFVDAPDKGSVGAILISPSNVVSAKVIEEL